MKRKRRGSYSSATRIGLLFKQIIERGARVVGRSYVIGRDRARRRGARRSAVAHDSHAGREQLAFVGLIFIRDARRDRLDALEACRRLEVGALLAAVEGRGAF